LASRRTQPQRIVSRAEELYWRQVSIANSEIGRPRRANEKQVPALVVVDDAGPVEDIFPPDFGRKYLTIADALARAR